MVISDVLFDAQKEIEDLVAGGHDEPGCPLRDEIDELLKQMERVRANLGTPSPLLDIKQRQRLRKSAGQKPLAKIHRAGLGFYALRHTFETIGGESRDQVAVNHVMGHADASMAGVYRERISDERLVAVVNHVHTWLFPMKKRK
jgi:integrase